MISRQRVTRLKPTFRPKQYQLILLAFILLSSVTVRPARSELVIDAVVAIVGDEIVTQSDLDRLARIAQENGRSDDRSALIHRLIEERLILQEVRKKRISVRDSEIEFALSDIESRNGFPNRDAFKKAVIAGNQSWRQYVSDLENQLLILKLLGTEVNTNLKVDEMDLRHYYDTHPDQFGLPNRIRLSRLLLRLGASASEKRKKQVEEKLTTIGDALKKGNPFEALVKEYSDGPRAERGGDIGFFKPGDLAPGIEQLLEGLEVGANTVPHYTSESVQIFKVMSRDTNRTQDFESVRKEIRNQLLSEQRAALQAQWIASLFERTYVDIK
jgi:peptidyl-prolyl cis-trans isomerase SurA